MLKISIAVFAIAACHLVHGYNYGDNQQASLEQQQQVRGSFMRPSGENKWSSGFASNNPDGSYIIRPQFSRPQSTILNQQRNSDSRSEPAALRSTGQNGNLLPNSGFVNNGDHASSERTNQRLLLPDAGRISKSSDDVQSGGLSGSVPGSLLSKDVPQQSSVSKKNEQKNEQQVPASSDSLPLSSLNRIRPQSHSSQPYFYRSETLEQMINRRSADKFLGPAFIQQQLINQKGENKFLRVHGKEVKEVNGTIEVRKGGLVNASLQEVKDGAFSVMDRENRKVGDVTMHRDVEKSLSMREKNGVTNVELDKNSNAELDVTRDIQLAPRIRPYGQPNSDRIRSNPSHRIRVHLEQNQNSRANVEIAKNKEAQQSSTTASPDRDNNGRFRRDTHAANMPFDVSALQNSTFIRKVGSVFSNLAEKLSGAMGASKSKVCGVLMNNSASLSNRLEKYDEHKPPIDLGKVMDAAGPNAPSQEEQGKMKKLFNGIQRNALKMVSSLTNRAIVLLKNCSEVTSSDKVYNGPVDANSQIRRMPNGQNVLILDTTLSPAEAPATSTEPSTPSTELAAPTTTTVAPAS